MKTNSYLKIDDRVLGDRHLTEMPSGLHYASADIPIFAQEIMKRYNSHDTLMEAIRDEIYYWEQRFKVIADLEGMDNAAAKLRKLRAVISNVERDMSRGHDGYYEQWGREQKAKQDAEREDHERECRAQDESQDQHQPEE